MPSALRTGVALLASLLTCSPTIAGVAAAGDANARVSSLESSASREDVIDRAASAQLRDALAAAQDGNEARARTLLARLPDPVARKLVAWVMAANGAGAEAEAAYGFRDWPAFPKRVSDPRSPGARWLARRRLINAALRGSDYRRAYALAAAADLPSGPDLAEAEFYAGWLSLRKLHQPQTADAHFSRIAAISSSPISQARALYWRGRAAEASGDSAGAQARYRQAAEHQTTFYGQLAAEKTGEPSIALGRDPLPSETDRAAFDERELVQAVRLLLLAGEDGLLGSFATAAAASLEQPGEYVLLIDLLRGAGRQFDSMRVARLAAQHGFILPERAYPGAARELSSPLNAAFLRGLIRQESGFDPEARSPSGARGLMQLMPSTAQLVAKARGLPYSPARLNQPSYNVALGSAYLGSLLSRFDGSYVMASAAYNAGPGHLDEWVATCGDPRASATAAIDFIECIPLSETRNYVMRVMEGMQVYRAKLGGGDARLSLERDLARGS